MASYDTPSGDLPVVEHSQEDFASDNDFICDILSDVEELCEPLDRYATPDGSFFNKSRETLFYPVQIGQHLNEGRYQILHRLGHGGFSTVWMAKDTTTKDSEEVVALKIIANGIGSEDGDMEHRIHEVLKNSNVDTSHLLLCQDTFTLRGPHGNHSVLVLPLAGPGLSSVSVMPNMYVTERPLKYRMSAAKQLLGAIQALHQAGLVHRDISMSNVLWQIKPEFRQTLAHDPEFTGEHRKMSFKTRWKDKDGNEMTASGDRVMPFVFPQDSLDDKIFLSDFGITIKAGTPVEVKDQGIKEIVSPDLYHGYNPSPASDMWSFMVLVLYLYTGHTPFHGGGLFRPDMPGDFVQSMVTSLGPLPSEWGAEGRKPRGFKSEWYAEAAGSGQFPRPDRTLESRVRRGLVLLEKRQAAGEGGRDVAELAREMVLQRRAEPYLVKVIGKVFRYKPEERVTASELLDDPDWSMVMAICGVDGEGLKE